MKEGPDCPYGVLVGLTGQGQHARPETTFWQAAAVSQPTYTFRSNCNGRARATSAAKKCKGRVSPVSENRVWVHLAHSTVRTLQGLSHAVHLPYQPMPHALHMF